MNKKAELEEFDGVEMTAESRMLAEEAERKQNAKPDAGAADEDDDDSDLFSDDDDDDISKYYVDDDVPEDADGDYDEEEDASAAAADHDDDVKPEAKPKSKAQMRIAELAEKRREAEKEAFDAQMKNVELERRLEALEKGKAEAAPKVTITPKPDPKDFAYGEVDNKYIDALVEHRLSTERAKFHQEQGDTEAQRKQAASVEHYKARLAVISTEGAKKFGPNYDKVVNKKRTDAPSTPSRRGKPARARPSADVAKYGPDDQDAFDAAFYS